MRAARCASQRASSSMARSGADLGTQSVALWGAEQFAAQSFDWDFNGRERSYSAAWREARELGQATSGARQMRASRF